jgi:hypothetical protein
MQLKRRAPELSATSRIVLIPTINRSLTNPIATAPLLSRLGKFSALPSLSALPSRDGDGADY